METLLQIYSKGTCTFYINSPILQGDFDNLI